MSEEVILTKFKNTLINFLDDIIEQIPSQQDLIIIRLFLKDQVPIKLVMDKFIQNVLPYKEMILARDEEFFMKDDASFFDKLSSKKVNQFRDIYKSNHLDNDDRAVIWDWLISFVKLAEKYQQVLGGGKEESGSD